MFALMKLNPIRLAYISGSGTKVAGFCDNWSLLLTCLREWRPWSSLQLLGFLQTSWLQGYCCFSGFSLNGSRQSSQAGLRNSAPMP